MEDILKLLSQGFDVGQKSIDENEVRFKVRTSASAFNPEYKNLLFVEFRNNRKSKPVFRPILSEPRKRLGKSM